MNARWHRPCQVCLSPNARSVYENRMAMLAGLDLSYSVAECSDCGFVFANRLAEPAVYERYYRELSKYDFLPSADTVPAVDRLRTRAVVDICREHISRSGRVADLGCGSGVLLNAFREAGWKGVFGIDPAPDAPEQARRLFGIETVRCGSLRDAAAMLDLEAIDLVCLTGVLEHLPELHEEMVRLTAHLGPRAKILVEVPALERFERAPFEPFGEFSLEHVQYFTSRSLVSLLARFGFAPISVGVLPLPQGTTDSLVALFERRASQAGESPAIGIDPYIRASEAAFSSALAKVDSSPAERILVYGAGSHTCRLLPRLAAETHGRICGVVDGNPNLQGKILDRWTIKRPEAIAKEPDAAILVSSFRSQQNVTLALRSRYRNECLCLY